VLTEPKIYDFFVQMNSFIVFEKQVSVSISSASPAFRFIPMNYRDAHCNQVYFTSVNLSILNPTAAAAPAFSAGLKQMAGLS